MAKFTKFEDIQAWQKARKVAQRIYALTAAGTFARDFALRDQIRRSGVSIMANIAEGHGRLSNKEFAHFLNIAHGSITETQSHLYIALDLLYLGQEDFEELYQLLDETARMVTALRKYLSSTSSPNS